MSVITEIPSTFIPEWTATTTSDGPLNLMDRVGAGCISRILSGSGGILEDKT